MLRMHTASKLLGACRRRWQASVYGGPCRFCFALNVAPLRETKNLRPLNDMPHCEKSKGRSHATAQRRNVKAQVMGYSAMFKLTVTALTWFFRRKRSICRQGRNSTPTNCTLPHCVTSVIETNLSSVKHLVGHFAKPHARPPHSKTRHLFRLRLRRKAHRCSRGTKIDMHQ